MPTEKTSSRGVLEDKTVVIYGDSGIGKSTFASEWAGGDMFFFDVAGELNDLDVYKSGMNGTPAITDWTSFRLWCASYAKAQEGTPQFKGAVIDTGDVLGMFCAQFVAKQLGIVHHSDAQWGKGWDMLKREWGSHLAKLMALPGGLLVVSHAKEKTIKRRREEYSRFIPTLTGGVGELTVNAADLVLFIDWAEDTDDANGPRVICTKPDKHFEAKERGQAPRLPAEIEWPVGRSGYDVLREAWYANDNTGGK